MRKNTHETWSFLFRKKVRGISALATKAGDTIWIPKPGQKMLLTHAFVYIPVEGDPDRAANGITGTVTTEPNIELTNGTTTVADSTDLPITNGALLPLSLGSATIFDHDHPLTLVQSVAQVGATVFNYDLILVAVKLTL